MWRRSTVAFSFTFGWVSPEILWKVVSSRLQRICREERQFFFHLIISSWKEEEEFIENVWFWIRMMSVVLYVSIYLIFPIFFSPPQSNMRSKTIALSDAMSFRRHLNIKWTQTQCAVYFCQCPTRITHIIIEIKLLFNVLVPRDNSFTCNTANINTTSSLKWKKKQ